MEAQKAKKPVGGKLLKQLSVREGAIPMVGKKVKKLINNFKYFIKIQCKLESMLKIYVKNFAGDDFYKRIQIHAV